MTISNTSSEIIVQGDGSTTTFSYPFLMPSASFASLIYTNTQSTTSTITSGLFSMTGIGVDTGGTFTYPTSGSAISTSTTLTLRRILPLVQNSTIANQGNFYPATVDGALDYLTMIVQQQQQDIVDLQARVDALEA